MIRVTLTIPDDVYAALQAVSRQSDTSLDEMATEALRRGMPPISAEMPDDDVGWDTLSPEEATRRLRRPLGCPDV
jgi:hypothetical protein